MSLYPGLPGLVKIGSTPCQKVLVDLRTKIKYYEKKRKMFKCANKIIHAHTNTPTQTCIVCICYNLKNLYRVSQNYHASPVG